MEKQKMKIPASGGQVEKKGPQQKVESAPESGPVINITNQLLSKKYSLEEEKESGKGMKKGMKDTQKGRAL